MKKDTYIQPQIKVFTIMANSILAGSLEVQSDGITNEQYAKPHHKSSEFEDDFEDEQNSNPNNNYFGFDDYNQ